MKLPSIPRRTQAELASPAAPGGRHGQIVRLALPLIGAGLSPEAVFAELRNKYASDVSDFEIRRIVTWAKSKNPQPTNYGIRKRHIPFSSISAPVTAASATAAAERFLGAFRVEEADLFHTSRYTLEDWKQAPLLLIATLYAKEDHVNIVSDFLEEKSKARPVGAGKTMRRDDWLRCLREQGTPQSRAGAWFRPNPVAPSGKGSGGAMTDTDVTAHRFLLLESDSLPPELQLSVMAALPLPIVAITASGGRSYHALVKIDAPDAATYRELAARVFLKLAPLGFDSANKNPSRMSRLPGARRVIGAGGDGAQRLLFLNPDANGSPIFSKILR